MKINYIDIHSHVQDSAFNTDRDAVILRMEEAGVATITIGTGIETSRNAVQLADTHTHIYATVGLHPVDDAREEFNAAEYEVLARHERVVAIGECGLDYHYIETFFEKDKVEKGISWNRDAEADRQKRFFEEQIGLAVRVGKPLMLHGRSSPHTMDAYEDMCDILANAQIQYGERVRGNFHFFCGDVRIARRVLDLGFTMSFPGVITFASQYDEVVQFAPLDSIHGETDAPYAAPKPFRGTRNEPIHVREVYRKIAALRGLDDEVVRMALLQNAVRVFGLTV